MTKNKFEWRERKREKQTLQSSSLCSEDFFQAAISSSFSIYNKALEFDTSSLKQFFFDSQNPEEGRQAVLSTKSISLKSPRIQLKFRSWILCLFDCQAVLSK